MSSLFPISPSHGMVYELRSGLYFKYDATIRSWIKLTSTGVTIPLATSVDSGAMSAVDFRKLNRLVLPPPISSIIGTDCVSPFRSGSIGFSSGDKFVGVEGTVKVQNIGPRGELLSQDVPFHIHQHTYGFDFTVDLPELVDELKLRKQFNVAGRKGGKGEKGQPGPAGPDQILVGPPGDDGQDGPAPPCGLIVEPDELLVEANEGMTKALVAGKVVFDDEDPLKYKIVFDRQTIGPTGYAAERLRVQDDTSPWVLAVTGDQIDSPIGDPRSQVACGAAVGTGRTQKIYYIDVEPIVYTVRDRYLREATIIRGGYQNTVKFWVQTMSDLFDEQKTALCCALEHCRSIKKNAEVRHNIESLSAAAAGSANVLLHGRDSNEAVNLSSTRTLKQIGGPDLCRNGPRFPQFPNLETGGVGGFETNELALSNESPAIQRVGTETAVKEAIVALDPLIHSTLGTAVQVPLLAGDYTAVLVRADAKIDGKHRSNAKIQYLNKGALRSVQFLDKGEFVGVLDAKSAYEGLGLSFHHDGGMIWVWLPSLVPQNTSGTVEMLIQQVATPQPLPAFVAQVDQPKPVAVELAVASVDESVGCRMSVAHLRWYERGWESGDCCGLVINILGQDYIVVKRSLGSDVSCGGGESESEPCIAKFSSTVGHPAFAWPTFDGKTFVPLPSDGFVNFRFDEKLNDSVIKKISGGEFEDGKGNPSGVRHLTHQLTTILFPST